MCTCIDDLNPCMLKDKVTMLISSKTIFFFFFCQTVGPLKKVDVRTIFFKASDDRVCTHMSVETGCIHLLSIRPKIYSHRQIIHSPLAKFFYKDLVQLTFLLLAKNFCGVRYQWTSQPLASKQLFDKAQ